MIQSRSKLKRRLFLIGCGLQLATFILLSAFHSPPENLVSTSIKKVAEDKLKKQAFKILESKCNVCHRKQNPFMVFNEKNMIRRAKKIHNVVFVDRRMPKGNEITLSNEEYITLEKWLFTQIY